MTSIAQDPSMELRANNNCSKHRKDRHRDAAFPFILAHLWNETVEAPISRTDADQFTSIQSKKGRTQKSLEINLLMLIRSDTTTMVRGRTYRGCPAIVFCFPWVGYANHSKIKQKDAHDLQNKNDKTKQKTLLHRPTVRGACVGCTDRKEGSKTKC